jgi:hypothetical protein
MIEASYTSGRTTVLALDEIFGVIGTLARRHRIRGYFDCEELPESLLLFLRCSFG